MVEEQVAREGMLGFMTRGTDGGSQDNDRALGASGLYFFVSYRPPFIVALLFYPEDGDNMSFRNCGSSSPNYTA